VRWYRVEWQREVPTRVHERGVEPESALGAPRLAGAFRAYLMGDPMATDHDDRFDMTTGHDARRRPIHAALQVIARRWPLSARLLFLLGCNGGDWETVTLGWKMLPEVGFRFTQDSLRQLWDIWQRQEANI